MNKWEFIYEEEIEDAWGANFIGIISNGRTALFFHALKDKEKDPIEKCHIFSSMQCFMRHEEEELSYDWTAENDEMLLEFLNNNTNEIGNIDVGEGSKLQQIKFLPYYECESYGSY